MLCVNAGFGPEEAISEKQQEEALTGLVFYPAGKRVNAVRSDKFPNAVL